MDISIGKSNLEEAPVLVEIYNAAFYHDYIRFGSCPGYGHTVEDMKKSIQNNYKFTIYVDKKPVGAISLSNEGNGIYHIGCLCVIPQYQGKGIGTKSIKFIEEEFTDWKELTLETPADKEENVDFYCKKGNFQIVKEIMDGNTKLYCFSKKNKL